MGAVDGLNNAFKTGYKVKLQNRGANSSGITFELKSIFNELAKNGLIKDKDKDNQGLSKQDALKLYEMLNQIHQSTNRATNYTRMQAGQEFNYSAEEMLKLAQAAGYEVASAALPESKPEPKAPPKLEGDEAKPKPLQYENDINQNEPLQMPDGLQESITKSSIESLGGKIIEREVNGEKTKVAVVDIGGQKVRRQINEDGTLGDTLAQIGSSNRYLSGDFPPETEILEREVNGKKQQIGVFKDENGNKVRQLVDVDPETGNFSLGEKLVPISTAGKNKYITQTEMDNRIAQVFPEGLPEGVTASFVTIGGESTMVFKKDGKTLDQAQLRELTAQSKTTEPGYMARSEQHITDQPPVYYNEDSLSTAKEPIPAPVTGPKEGENPEYDAAVRGKSPIADNQPANSNEEPKSKTFTNEEIQNNIKNLKPGESFTYRHTSSIRWGNGSSYEEKNITWKREEDGTLTKTAPEFTQASNSRQCSIRLSTRYSADGKTVISQDVPAQTLVFAKELKSTKNFENGEPSTLTTDLTNLDNNLRPLSYGNNDPVNRMLSSLTQQTKIPRYSSKFSTQEFKDTSGNSVVTFKDGKFFDEKNKEIDFKKAYKILSKLHNSNQLSSLVQVYKKAQAE